MFKVQSYSLNFNEWLTVATYPTLHEAAKGYQFFKERHPRLRVIRA